MLADANQPSTDPKPEGQGRQRLTSTERRAAIVKVAVDLFSRHGFRGTTTRELAAVVGVSEPVLYQHFATKRDLHTAIVDQMIAKVAFQDVETLERLAQGHDDQAFFTELGHQILSWHSDDTQHTRLLLYSALEGNELADLWQERAIAEFLGLVERYIARRAGEGAFRAADPRLAARAFVGMVGHFGMMTAIFKCPLPAIPREVILDGFVSMFLNGIRQTPQENS